MLTTENKDTVSIMKTSSGTDSKKLASSIIAHHQANKDCTTITIRAIGAAAVNQALKAVIISNRHFSRKGQMLSVIPAFHDLEENGQVITAVDLKTKFVNF